jgi:hypothetical protein
MTINEVAGGLLALAIITGYLAARAGIIEGSWTVRIVPLKRRGKTAGQPEGKAETAVSPLAPAKAAGEPELKPETVTPVLTAADGNRPPNGRDRYNVLRDEGKTPEEARAAAGIKERTARTYESERRLRGAA